MKFLRIFFFIIIPSAVTGCPVPRSAKITNAARVYVSSTDPSLETKQGVLYRRQAPFRGWIYEVYDNGDTASLTPYVQGREQGLGKRWYPNRQIAEWRWYYKGKKTGIHRGWWPNGRLQYSYYFSNDLYEGNIKEWYEDGTPYRDMHYHNGQESGLQKIWRPDGTLLACYEARNGRNYGLTGRRECRNTLNNETD